MKESLEQEIARLKKRLAAYEVDTIEAQSYIALRRYIQENNKLLMMVQVTGKDKKLRDEELEERARKYSLEVKDYIDMIKELGKGLTATIIEETEKNYGNSLEEALELDDSK